MRKYGELGMCEEIFHTFIVSKDTEKFPIFYRKLLRAWQEVAKYKIDVVNTYSDVLEQPICRNHNIMYNNQMLDLQMFTKSGIVKIKDILYEVIPGFLPLNAIHELVTDNFENVSLQHVSNMFNVIKGSIPETWKNIVTHDANRSQV